MKSASLVLAAAATLAVATAGCSGMKDAFTAHVDTAARAGGQELSVDRLAALMSRAKVPPRPDVATAIANAWADYESLAQASARGDTTVDQKTMDRALWASIASIKARKYYELVSKSWAGATGDTAAARQQYANGDILAASHILLVTRGATPQQKAAIRQKAEALRGQATAANFAQLAKANSQDPASAQRGGSLGIFPRGAMVPAFEKALLATPPGQISPVIETEYGFHIIRRPTFDEVKGAVVQAASGHSTQVAESTFVAQLQRNGHVALASDAAARARAVIADPAAHANDNATLATSAAGNFTAARLAQWLSSFPPLVQAQQKAQLPQAPDSVLQGFVKQFVTNELVLHAADSLKLGPTPQDLQALRDNFIRSRDAAWTALHVDPKSLADSAPSVDARVKLAAARVDRYMEGLVTGQVQYVQLPPAVSEVLRAKEGATINGAGIDRAVQRAVKERAATDSAQRAGEPPTAVPLPGSAPAGGAAPPAGAAPAAAQPAPGQSAPAGVNPAPSAPTTPR